jgi:hypothetical protein
MKKIIIFLVLLLAINLSFAQSLSRKVIGSAGILHNNNYKLSFTVGEPAITKLTNSANTLCQGFQQGDLDIDTTTGIPVIGNEEFYFKLFPNPNNGNFTFYYHLPSINAEFQILDVVGRVVYKNSIIGVEGSLIIDASYLSNGIYFYQIISNKETAQGKFVVQK